jgi:hypothetical protein
MSSLKRHFTAVIGNKEQGTYVSSSPSSAARKAVSKLCADDKKRKVVFSIRETTRDSNKKVYGPYIGYMEKLDKPVELEGRMIKYKSVAKLDKKKKILKGGALELSYEAFETKYKDIESKFVHSDERLINKKGLTNLVPHSSFKNRPIELVYEKDLNENVLFFGKKIMVENQNETKYYFSVAITSEDDNIILYFLNYSTNSNNFTIKELYEHELKCGVIPNPVEFKKYMPYNNPPFGKNINKKLDLLNIIVR